MIEQIINWWNVLDKTNKENICIILIFVLPFLSMLYFAFIRDYIINKKKTTTQKFREGLIKK